MKYILYKTNDNSHTVYSHLHKSYYHSTHGAIQESQHIFIESGLKQIDKKEIAIFEVGFGTGLNTMLSYEYAIKNKININYTAIELYPLEQDIISDLNYSENKNINSTIFDKIHKSSWDKNIKIDNNFSLKKLHKDLKLHKFNDKYNIIFFDAFAPEIQPDLWTVHIFTRIFSALKPKGVLLTYSAKGIVKQALRDAGFFVKRLKGPPGKRHIVLAQKE